MADDFSRVREESERQGWRWELRPGGHWMGFAPDGKSKVAVGSTPSDHRALKNTIARMRRAGFNWKGR